MLFILDIYKDYPDIKGICGENLDQHVWLKQSIQKAVDLPNASSMDSPGIHIQFNPIIGDFVKPNELQGVIHKASKLGREMILYEPKFLVDYAISRIIMGYDINSLSIDHITNLW